MGYTEKSCELRDFEKRYHYLLSGSNDVKLSADGKSGPDGIWAHRIKEALVPDYPGYKVGCKHGPKKEHDFAMLVIADDDEFRLVPHVRPICLLGEVTEDLVASL